MSKVYNVVIQQYRDYKIRVCEKDSIPLSTDKHHSKPVLKHLKFLAFYTNLRCQFYFKIACNTSFLLLHI